CEHVDAEQRSGRPEHLVPVRSDDAVSGWNLAGRSRRSPLSRVSGALHAWCPGLCRTDSGERVSGVVSDRCAWLSPGTAGPIRREGAEDVQVRWGPYLTGV